MSVMTAHLAATTIRSLLAVGSNGWELAFLRFLGQDYINLGRSGIIIFFLISGYLVPFSFSGQQPIRHFLISRFFRLYPLFWASLLLVAPLLVISGKPVSLGGLLANATMVPDLIGSERMLDVYWTLTVEMVFYVIVLGLAVMWGPMRLRTAVIASAGAFLVCIAASWMQAEGLRAWGADKVFLIGVMFMGTTLRAVRGRGLGQLAWTTVMVTLFVLATWSRAYVHFVLKLYGPSNEFIGYSVMLTSDLAGLSVFLLHLTSRVTWRPLVGAGLISYSVYILHPIVMMISDELGWTQTLVERSLYLPLISLLAIGLSVLTYLAVEKPAVSLGRQMRHLFGVKPAERKVTDTA